MKLCLINPTRLLKHVILHLGLKLQERDLDVEILCPDKSRIRSKNIKIKFKTFSAFFIPKIRYTIPNIILFKHLIDYILDNKFDLIQVANYEYLTSLIPILVKKKGSISIIITIDSFPGISWKYGNRLVDFIAKIYTHSIGKFILKYYDSIILLSKKTFRDGLELGVNRDKLKLIYPGIEVDKFKKPDIKEIERLRNKLGISKNENVILFVGRLDLVKRVDVVIRATELLLKEGVKVRTIIVGDGEYRERYKKMAEKLGNTVIFTGWIDRDKLPVYYAMADVLILPSLSEGLPGVILESSSCGTPCIGSSVGGIPEAIIHGKTGFLADPNSIESLVTYLKLLLIDKKLNKKMSKLAQSYIMKQFNWDKNVEKFLKLYEGVVND